EPHALRELRLDVARQLRPRVVDHRRAAADQRSGQRRALPAVVVSGLRNGRPESPLELRLQRDELPALALEASVFGEVQVDLDEADEAHSSSRSTCLVSKISITSPSLTSA